MSSGECQMTMHYNKFFRGMPEMTNKLSNILRNKSFPTKRSILFVYSIIAYLVYSWTFITFFYKLPSWINYLKFNEIAVIFAYSMSTDAFESLLFLGEIILL